MCSCDINPQPEVPSDDEDGTGGEAGAPNAGPIQRTDDDDQEYDDLDPNLGSFSDKTSDPPDADTERPDSAPPPSNYRQDAGPPGVVN